MRATVLLAALALSAGCKHRPTEKEQRAAETHYNLGRVAAQSGSIQEAAREYQAALALDEGFPEAHNGYGLLLHLSFGRREEAIQHYKRALEIRPNFSDAKTSLGVVYMDLGKYDEAIKLFDEALNDMLYAEPYIAHANRGWALFKKGDVRGGMESIQMAVTTNPKFCLGYKLLGQIHDEQVQTELACDYYGRFRDACPDAAEAYYQEGVCLAKLGKTEEARKDFAACQTKSVLPGTRDFRADCKRLLEQMQ
jgi:type IV pilus assembly protein PilF